MWRVALDRLKLSRVLVSRCLLGNKFMFWKMKVLWHHIQLSLCVCVCVYMCVRVICLCVCPFWSSAAAVVIQQLWRKYRQKCGNISSPSTAEKRGGRGGDGVMPRPGPSYINGSVVGQDHAATVIQVKLLEFCQTFWTFCLTSCTGG